MRKTVHGAETATRFVNISSVESAKSFEKEYKADLRPGITPQFLLNLATSLRQAWDKGKREAAQQNIEQIFSDRLAESTQRHLAELKPDIAVKEGPHPDEWTKMERPAFTVSMGKANPVFIRPQALGVIPSLSRPEETT